MVRTENKKFNTDKDYKFIPKDNAYSLKIHLRDQRYYEIIYQS